MHNPNVWELPFSESALAERAVLELRTEFGNLTLLPVEPGQLPRLELSRGWSDVDVHVDRAGGAVRVAIDPRPSLNWFSSGNWDLKAYLYVPRNVHAALETNAGSVHVRNLDGCELGIKANAGKIDLVDVYGLMHLSADAGSITGRGLGGYFDVEAHAGSVRLEILDLQPGEHRVRASMGSVRIELGRGMDVCVETRTALGSVRCQYPTRADAPARLVLSTEMGSVRVEEASLPRAARRPATVAAAASSSIWAAGGAATSADAPREDAELERILKMVEAGELSARDADELLRAMGRV